MPRFDGKHQPRAYYEWHATLYDEDYDKDMDIQPARIFCAHSVRGRNLETAVSFLLNVDMEHDAPEAWAKTREWMKTAPPESLKFETAADDFLKSIASLPYVIGFRIPWNMP